MIPRRLASLLFPLLALPVVLALAGCNALKSIAIQPAAGSVVLTGVGQTAQFTAIGTSQMGNAQTTTGGVSANWSVSNANVATISSSGLATAVGPGYTQVIAESNGVSATSDIAVNVAAATTVGTEPLLSLTIIPGAITVDNLQGTGQFLAIGTYSTPPYVRDLTNSPNLTWISTLPSVFPVDSNSGGNSGATAGLVTAYGSGTVSIIAEATNPSDGTIQTAQASFNCPLSLPNPAGNPPTPGTCYPGTQSPALLATLTVYNEGLNTSNWEVTAPSATGTANVIHCGPGWTLNAGIGGSVCTATYPVGTTVTLTAPNTGAKFGGWSYNCGRQGVVTAAGPNSCTVTLSTNDTVGAIFN